MPSGDLAFCEEYDDSRDISTIAAGDRVMVRGDDPWGIGNNWPLEERGYKCSVVSVDGERITLRPDPQTRLRALKGEELATGIDPLCASSPDPNAAGDAYTMAIYDRTQLRLLREKR